MRLFWSVILLVMFVPQWMGLGQAPLLDPQAPFSLRPVALYPADPARRRLGALVFERGYRLTSRDPEFGGFSAMLTDGHAFTLLSDSGQGVRFRLDAHGRVRGGAVFALPRLPHGGWHGEDRDSEALTRDPAGHLWVSFETVNEIWRYAPGFARAEGHVAPPAMARWDENRGAEGFTRLASGRFVAIDENEVLPGEGCEGVVFLTDPVRAPRRGFRFRYLPPAGYKPTDIAELPDGRLVLLNRRADLGEGFTAIVTLLPKGAIRPGSLARGHPIARFAAPARHDNFEAIAVVSEPDAIKLWIASDNNQYWFEESLLLEFRLDEAALPPPLRRVTPPLRPARASSSPHASAGARAATADRPRS